MSIFVDTSGFFAVLDRDDVNHKTARELWAGLLEREVALVTSNYVLVETLALVQRRLGMAAVRALCSDVLPLIHQEWVTHDDHTAALAALMVADRRELSFVDVSSFQIMRRLGLHDALTFDAHFGEQGFAVLAG